MKKALPLHRTRLRLALRHEATGPGDGQRLLATLPLQSGHAQGRRETLPARLAPAHDPAQSYTFAAALDLFHTAHAHDHWDNGETVPAWVKTACCGPNDVHHLRPEQVKRNAAGDYVVDIYPFPIPARMALPSQDGEYWLFFYEDYGLNGMVRCFFVPALFYARANGLDA